ncbi:MAG: copper-binding protein [Acidobacteriaceae bacterium]|nr:copper-binding protein [Acidobacteriaceae bacterium]
MSHVKILVVLVPLLVFAAACSRSPESAAPAHRYSLTGKVVALNSQDHTALIDAAAIPNFMEAMTMEYPVRSRPEFDSLHAGDRITATVNVTAEGGYYLSDIKVQKPAH